MSEETLSVVRDDSGAVIHIGPWEYGEPLWDDQSWPDPDKPGEFVHWQTPRLDEDGNPVMSNPLPEGATVADEIVVTEADGGRHVKGDYSTFPILKPIQLRIGLINGGVSPDDVTATISALPDGPSRQQALAYWEYEDRFHRDHPLIIQIAGLMGLTDTQVDAMWLAAAEL